ncbi:hypothetical protein V6Z11_D11G028800 [Gossypium hirsutum]
MKKSQIPEEKHRRIESTIFMFHTYFISSQRVT